MSDPGPTPEQSRSYYGRPVIKAPVWTYDIGAYLFTGGLAAGSSLVAAGADLTGREALRRGSRLTALAALSASTWFLIHDLGRPSRFANMLRVFKPTSPMSMGTWILAGYGPMAGLAAASELAAALGEGQAGRALYAGGRAAGVAAAALAPAVATYTAVLLADTAVPAWHEAHRHLPFAFAGSALASGAGAALVLAPAAEAAPARRLALAGAGLELAGTSLLEHRLGLQSEAYRAPGPARLLRLARGLTLTGATAAVVGRHRRTVNALSGAALLAGSVCTRFGVYRAGLVSAADPRYTVLPQRQRVEDRRAADRRVAATARRGAPSPGEVTTRATLRAVLWCWASAGSPGAGRSRPRR